VFAEVSIGGEWTRADGFQILVPRPKTNLIELTSRDAGIDDAVVLLDIFHTIGAEIALPSSKRA
jgi:hypothetical protein